MSELDGLITDLKWIRRSMETNDKMIAEIFERLRTIESDLASIQANQRPAVSGWTIFGVIGTIVVSVLLILDRIYVNQ